MLRRGWGRRGIAEGDDGGEEVELSRSENEDIFTGNLADAAIEGLRSCCGDGCLLMEAACMVEAISIGADAMLSTVAQPCIDRDVS